MVRRVVHAIAIHLRSGDVGLADMYNMVHGRDNIRTSADAKDATLYAFFADLLLWRPCTPAQRRTFIHQELKPFIAVHIARAEEACRQVVSDGNADVGVNSNRGGSSAQDNMSDAGSVSLRVGQNQTPEQAATAAHLRTVRAIFAKISNSSGLMGIANAALIGSSAPDVAALLNRDPAAKDLLPVRDGQMLCLRTGALRPRAYIWSFELPWTYRTPSEVPRGPAGEHMLELLNGDVGAMLYFQEQVGYALTGDTSEKTLWILQGGTDCAKSRTVELIRAVMGPLCTEARDIVWMKDKRGDAASDAATPALVALIGARLAIKNESAKADVLSSVKVKSLTGGDRITVRKLYGEQASFDPLFKCWIVTNDRPAFDATDSAMVDRMALLEFKHRYARTDANVAYFKNMVAHRVEEFASWMVDGAMRFYHRGTLPPRPAGMRAAAAAYISANDPVERFVSECIAARPGNRLLAGAAWGAFQRFMNMNPAMSRKDFIATMRTKHNISSTKDHRSTVFFLDVDLDMDN
jgi:P4 family phage/plasmid primase-like protien